MTAAGPPRAGRVAPRVRGSQLHVTVLIAAAALVLCGTAAAQPASPSLGYDLSYPQCSTVFPAGAAFAIVGVNAGLPFSPNPCLGSGGGSSELAWAGAGAQFYANTANPGPALSSHWPNGQTAPQQCNTPTSPGADTTSCAYDYGWNAALDSYQDAVDAYVALGLAPAGSTRTPVANTWWLDVESANSWEANTADNVAELQGEVGSLEAVGVTTIGFYAPAQNWQAIVGDGVQFAAFPYWLPGASSLADAESHCFERGPNGGPTVLVQFSQAGTNTDVSCAGVPRLAFGTAAQTLRAGAAGGLAVSLPIAATDAVTISLASSSTTGLFAPATAGPWTRTFTITVPAGATRTPPFYYRDSTPGSPQLHATADGYAAADQTETIAPAPACTVPAQHDRGYEIVLAHAHTRADAKRLRRDVPTRLDGQRLRTTIETDSCTDYELALPGPHPRKAALALVRRLRHRFNDATLEYR